MRPSLSSSGAGSAVGMVRDDAVALAAFKRVSKYQRGQIISLALAFIFSTAACLALSYVNYVLSPECILFATWTGQKTSAATSMKHGMNNHNETAFGFVMAGRQVGKVDPNKEVLDINDDKGRTKWGKKKNCYLTQYGYAAAATCSFILCWFFVFFRPTKEAYLFKKTTAASKLIIPAIVFSLAFTITVFVSAITLQLGTTSWCNNIYDSYGNELFGSCSEVQNYALKWQYSTPTYVNYYSLLIAGLIFGWFGAFAWLASLIILTIRCYLHVDFPDYFFEHSVVSNDGFQTDDTEHD